MKTDPRNRAWSLGGSTEEIGSMPEVRRGVNMHRVVFRRGSSLLGFMGLNFLASLALLLFSSPLLLLFSPLLSFIGLVFVGVLTVFVAATTTPAFRRLSGFIRRSGVNYFWVLAAAV
ncbi:hypothetical protein M0R45_000502 [Rubus argutus]|uniref:PRA1 family protein n=1 Tax=Rubus argutus TaxID=59490 RepID=A0AAW1VP38_RUBAR